MMMAALSGAAIAFGAHSARARARSEGPDQIGRTMVIWPVLDEMRTSNGAPRRKAV